MRELDRPDMVCAKPDWMSRAPVIPCDCNKYFFCIHNLTKALTTSERGRLLLCSFSMTALVPRLLIEPVSKLICKLGVVDAVNVTGKEMVLKTEDERHRYAPLHA